MYRDILTNKWVLGGVGFLIVFGVGCVLWYQHETADERKAAAAEELLRQSELSQKADTGTKTQSETAKPGENLEIDLELETVKTPKTKQGISGTAEAQTETENQRITPQAFMEAIKDDLVIPEHHKAFMKRLEASRERLKETQPIWDEISKVNKQINELFPDGDMKNYASYIPSLNNEERAEFISKFLPLMQRKIALYKVYNAK